MDPYVRTTYNLGMGMKLEVVTGKEKIVSTSIYKQNCVTYYYYSEPE